MSNVHKVIEAVRKIESTRLIAVIAGATRDIGIAALEQCPKEGSGFSTASTTTAFFREGCAIPAKNIVMCLTTGRSGTNLLQALLALASDTCALHEPEPAFHHVLEEVRLNPAAATAFVAGRKLPDILTRPGANYVETSHLFGKGFFEAFLELSIPFKLIVLDRPPREVAKSLWRIKTVPARTRLGRGFLLHPAQEGVLRIENWRRLSDYQLCFWYCLEVERRKTLCLCECARRNIPAAEISLEKLKDWESFRALCAACDLELPEGARARHAEISVRRVNPKSQFWPKIPLRPYARQEEGVWRALGAEGAALRKDVEQRYGRKPAGE